MARYGVGFAQLLALLCIAKVETNQPDYVSFLLFRFGFTQLSPVNWRPRTIFRQTIQNKKRYGVVIYILLPMIVVALL